MKNKLTVFFVILILFVVSADRIKAQEKLSIETLKEHVTVNTNGTVSVKEEIRWKTGLTQWRAIHSLPYVIFKKNGKRYKYIYRDISIQSDGSKVPFSMYLENGNIKLEISSNKNHLIPKTIFIYYSIEGVIEYEKEFDSILWKTGRSRWDIPVDTAEVSFSLPYTISNKYRSNCTVDTLPCTLKTSSKSMYFYSPHLNRGEMIINFRFPKDKIEVRETTEYISIFKTWKGIVFLLVTALLLTMWYLLYPIFIFIKHRRANKKIISSRIKGEHHLRDVKHFYLLLIPLSFFTLNILLLLTIILRVLPFYVRLRR